jgi:hypothetical protein
MVNQVMTSTYSIGTIGSVASLLVATLYQGNHDMNHKYEDEHTQGVIKSRVNRRKTDNTTAK